MKAADDMREFRRLLGRRVRCLRAERHWSQSQLALKTGLDRTFLSKVEHGSAGISCDTIVALAHAFGLSPSALLEGIADPATACAPARRASGKTLVKYDLRLL